MIEEENREKILNAIPEKDDEMREWAIWDMDNNKGTIVKWGGEGHPRGMIYAVLIPEHVEKSPVKHLYNTELFKNSMNNLEEHKHFGIFAGRLNDINADETYGKSNITLKKDHDPLANDASYQAYIRQGV